MPAIIIKDYTWRQTLEFVILHVPLVGHPKSVHSFAIDNYVKVSFPPFILELFLWSNVIDEKSKCIVTNREAIFSLHKAEIGLDWPCLEIQDMDDETKRKYRNLAWERAQTIVASRTKQKTEKRQSLQREAVKAQIDIDTGTLNKISAMRDAHRKEAMNEFDDWKSKTELPFLQGVQGKIQENRKPYTPPLKWFKDSFGSVNSRELNNEEIFGENGKQSPTLATKKGEQSENLKFDRSVKSTHPAGTNTKPPTKVCKEKSDIFEEAWKSVPLPRKSSTINVTFTERFFPTPARESSHLAEQQWLEKQAEARRKTGFVAEDLRPEERDPQWLKDNGDDFFKVGNYLAAVSAYTHAIQISDKMSSVYANRSAAHYKLGNYVKCVEDCSKALELMEPKCERNRESRARCHARRGAALCKLSAPQHGIPELEAALELMPDNQSIKRDLLASKEYFNLL